MSKLGEISIRVEEADGPQETGNAIPLLHELRHALHKLLDSGEETILDLRSLPLGPTDEKQLIDMLGRGEVEAQLNALGKSLVWETRIPGIWLIEHLNAEDQLLGKYIEVTFIPALLKSQQEDIRQGLALLTVQLADAG